MNTKIDITYTGLPQLLPSEANELREHIRQFGPHLSIGTKAITEIAEHSGQSITIVNTITGSSKNYTVLQKSFDTWVLVDPDEQSLVTKLLCFLHLKNNIPTSNASRGSILEEGSISQENQSDQDITIAKFPALAIDTKTKIIEQLNESYSELSFGIRQASISTMNPVLLCKLKGGTSSNSDTTLDLAKADSQPNNELEPSLSIDSFLGKFHSLKVHEKIEITLKRHVLFGMSHKALTKELRKSENSKNTLQQSLLQKATVTLEHLELSQKITSIENYITSLQKAVPVVFIVSDALMFSETQTFYFLEFIDKPEKNNDYLGTGIELYIEVNQSKALLHSSVTNCPNFQKALKKGVNINANDGHHSILSLAVSTSQVYLVKRLLDLGAKTNLESMQHATTSLHIAAQQLDKNKIETIYIFKLLLKHGADLTSQNKERKTPLELIPRELREACKVWFPEIKDHISCTTEATFPATEKTPLLSKPIDIPKQNTSQMNTSQSIRTVSYKPSSIV